MRQFDYISIKRKMCVEYRRYALSYEEIQDFDTFYKRIEELDNLHQEPFVIFYKDSDGVPLPINNDDNLAKAIKSADHIYLTDIHRHQHRTYNGLNGNYHPGLVRRPYLKILIGRREEFLDDCNGNLTGKPKKSQNFGLLSSLIAPTNELISRPSIGSPEDFRQVSSIIDVNLLPKTCRRVKILKHGTDRPLGFYIREGIYQRINSMGQVQLVTGVFISRLVPGGLAESTGLLAVNDEVLEVNGIVTNGKRLDQVTDMMVANASNLIMTIRPARIKHELRYSQGH